jgi:hypothetical protein
MHEGSGTVPLKKICLVFVFIFGRSSVFVSIYGWFFGTWFFIDGFLFLVKELGLLTNPSHWIRVLDVVGSYMYINNNNNNNMFQARHQIGV